jgi:hypothetical protein
MDGRKNNKGTRGNKGGRKPKADEQQLIEQMDAILAPTELWEAVAKKVREGDAPAQKLWASYRFGQPKQRVEVKTDQSADLPDWFNE